MKCLYYSLRLAVLCGLLSGIFCQTAFATRYYVKTDGSDAADGASWATAFQTLAKALSTATGAGGGDEIWMKAGTYAQDARLTMKNNVGIYGGFAGAEAALTERVPGANETVISGRSRIRLFHNQFTSTAPLTDSAILDSVTLSLGKAAPSQSPIKYDTGGAIYNRYASPTIINCIFTRNRAFYGAGIYNENSRPTITGCTFINNTAVFGAGVFNENARPLLVNCLFSTNTATSAGFGWTIKSYGGGMGNSTSAPRLTGCVFTANKADNGAGMSNVSSSPVLEDCTFDANIGTGDSSAGAGMNNTNSSKPVLNNCTIRGNTAANGAGISNMTKSNPVLTSCTISGNSGNYGAAMYSYNMSCPVVNNCTISGNTAVLGGGAFYNSKKSSPQVLNCTINGNTDNTTYAGTMSSVNRSKPQIVNCILWGNGSGGGIRNAKSTTTITYSIVQGGYKGLGNREYDPLLMPLGDYGGLVETMPVRDNSPAIATGAKQTQTPKDFHIPSSDATGQHRNIAHSCTMGAVEGNVTITFDGNGSTRGTPPPPIPPTPLGAKIIMPDAGTLARTGSVFIGWTAKPDNSGITYAPGANYPPSTAATTLYAAWTTASSSVAVTLLPADTVFAVGTRFDGVVAIAAPSKSRAVAKNLPKGMKLSYNKAAAQWEVKGNPSSVPKDTPMVYVTFEKKTLPIALPIEVRDVMPTTVGSFTGFLYSGTQEVIGTWKITTTRAGKISAQVVTVGPDGKQVKISSRENLWEPLRAATAFQYRTILVFPEKKSSSTHRDRELDVTVDITAALDTLNATGTNKTFDSAGLLVRTDTVFGQLNIFPGEKSLLGDLTQAEINLIISSQGIDWYLAFRSLFNSYGGKWINAQDDGTAWRIFQGKIKSATGVEFLNIRIGGLGKVYYSGKLPNGKTKFSGTTTLLNENGNLVFPFFNIIKKHGVESDLVEINPYSPTPPYKK